MFLTRIHLKNFMAYGEVDLDLSSVSKAAVCGLNGAGKSSGIIDSFLFGAYGITRKARSLASVVRTGATEAETEHEFIMGEELYRIMRRYSLKGQGSSTLDFAILRSGAWEPLNGDSIAATERNIVAVLKATAKTFTSSCIIMQDRSNAITAAGPAERKETLGKILGLEIYDNLHALSKTQLGAAKQELLLTESEIARHQAIADRELELNTQMTNVTEKIHDTRRAYERDDRARLEQEQIQSQLDAKREVRGYQLEQINKLVDRIAVADNTIEDCNIKMTSLAGLLAQASAIKDAVVEYQRLEVEYHAKKATARDLVALETDNQRLTNKLQELEVAVHSLETRAANLRAEFETEPVLQEEAAGLPVAQKQVAEFEDTKQRHSQTEKRLIDLKAALRDAEAIRDRKWDQLNAEIAGLRNKVQMLGESGCINVEQAACRFLADAKAAQVRLVAAEAELVSLPVDEIVQLSAQIAEATTELSQIGYNAPAHALLLETLEGLNEVQRQLEAIANKRELYDSLTEQVTQTFGQIDETRDAIEKTATEIAEQKALDLILASLKTKLESLKPLVDQAEALASALETKAQVEVRRDQAIAQKAEDMPALEKADHEARALDQECLNLQAMADPNVVARVKGLNELLNHLGVERSRLNGELIAVAKAKLDLKDLHQARETSVKKTEDLGVLVKAFSKNGIPAWIIENALPELEDSANDILGRLTNGLMSISIETQRELKDKKRDLAETLDINIHDDKGIRPYETFSGGEMFRIDFALRVGLAKMMAHRAGASLRLLVLDEGLGSLDAIGRVHVLEALEVARQDFDQILVITHIDEILDAFDQVLRVTPSPNGSTIELVSVASVVPDEVMAEVA